MYHTTLRQIWVILLFGALTAALGCSGGAKNPVTPTNEISGDFATQVYSGGTNVGEFTLWLNAENLTANIEPSSRQNDIIVTPYVKIKIVGLHWDPVTRVWDIDVTVENPTPYTAYGPWVVFTDIGDQKILDQDGFIWWVVNPGDPAKRMPLVAFCKANPQRRFNAHSIEPVHIRIHWPTWVNSFNPMKFFIDVSFPNPRQHPIVENVHFFQDSPVPELWTVNAFVKDWQVPPPGRVALHVWLDLNPIGQQPIELFDDGMHNDGAAADDIWGCQFNAVPPPQPTPLTVHAWDWQGYHFENDGVFGYFTPPCQPIRKLAEGHYSKIHQKVEVMLMNQQQWEYLWNLHGGDPPAPTVEWNKEQVIALILGDRMTGGYWIRVDCVRFLNDPSGRRVVQVEYTEMIPGPSCPTPDVITQPYFFFAIPRYENARAEFIKHEEVYDCPPPECHPFRMLDNTAFSNYHDAFEKLITNQDDWHRFWVGHGAPPPPPEVYWDKEKVVAINLGDRPTGGFWVRIDCVRFFEGGPEKPPLIQIEYTEMIPGQSCVVPDVITQPHAFFAIPAFPTNAIEFIKHQEVYECYPCQPFDVIDVGGMSNIRNKVQHVIRDQNVWTQFWNLHKPGTPVPPVNFNEMMVVAIVLGERSSTGYYAKIDCIQFRSDPFAAEVNVNYTEYIPDPQTCITNPVITSPYIIVATPRFDGIDKFFKKDTIYICQ